MKIENRYEAVSDGDSRRKGEVLVAWLRQWSERRIDSRLIDERRCVPPHVAIEFGNRGLFGMQVSERHGGLGLRNREIARVLEQAAAIDLGLGTWLLTSMFPGVRPIAAFATDELKDELLPRLAGGRMLAGYAQTEPGAGTHFPGMAATARATEDGGWLVSGDKIWIGNGTWAGVLTVMAHDLRADGRRAGMTALAIPVDRAGVTPGREMLSMGMRGMVQSEVLFRDVAVAPRELLGERGRGLDVGVDSMSWSRFAITATCVGATKRCAQLAHRFASRRTIATGRLLDHPNTTVQLANTVSRALAVDALLQRVAERLDGGHGVPVEIFAACKIAGSEFLCDSVDELVQILGSRGYDEANLVSQLLRDARVTRIFEGATEALVAYVGSQAVNPRAELHDFLRDDLESPLLAERVESAVKALRARSGGGEDGEPLPRPWQMALAGWVGLWALLAAAVAQAAKATPSPSWARAGEWTIDHFERAVRRAADGASEERCLSEADAVEEAVASLADTIGDVDRGGQGEKLDYEPLLQRPGAD